MNRIEDERIKFYLQHEARIREWAGLEAEVRVFADRFYRSLEADLKTALVDGRLADDGIEAALQAAGDWPGLILRRRDWPEGNEDPDVRLEWHRQRVRFSNEDHLICGVRTNVERYRQPFTKEACPNHRNQNFWWPAYANVGPPVGRFWEGDNLQEYRDRLVETVLGAWRDLAPLVDEAVSHHSVDG